MNHTHTSPSRRARPSGPRAWAVLCGLAAGLGALGVRAVRAEPPPMQAGVQAHRGTPPLPAVPRRAQPEAALDPQAAAARALAALRRRDPALVPGELTDPELLPLPGGHAVRYRQLHHGLPVWGAELVLHVDAAGELAHVERTVLEPDALRGVSPRPRLSPAAARAAVRRICSGDTASPQLVVDRESARLVYLVGVIDTGRFESALYLIDAQTGAVVRRIERLPYAAAPASRPARRSRA